MYDGQPYDSKADIWSVGCVFFEMLSGTTPYHGSNPRALFENIKKHDCRLPDEISVCDSTLEMLGQVTSMMSGISVCLVVG